MKSDPEFNIQFVELVQKHPCIYDHSIVDYRNSNMQEKAWTAIASTVCESVQDCKERWKNLRGCFTRYLKSSLSSKLKKPYYLSEYLHFLLPFTTTRGKDGRSQPYTTSAYTDDDEDSLNISEHEIQDEQKQLPQSPVFSLYHDINEPYGKKQKMHSESEDPDLAFLKSILPDMKEMTNSQKRKFKIAVLNTASKILDDSLAPASSTSSNVIRYKITSSDLEPAYQIADPLLLDKDIKYCDN